MAREPRDLHRTGRAKNRPNTEGRGPALSEKTHSLHGSLLRAKPACPLLRPALYIVGGWLLPGRKRVVPYSIQWLKRLKPAMFRQDLITLLDLLQQKRIKPLIAHRF